MNSQYFRWPRFLWDKKSKEFFDPRTVRVESYNPPLGLNFTDNELTSLTGAPAHSLVVCSNTGGVLDVTVDSSKLFEQPLQMSVLAQGRESKIAFMQFLKLRPNFQSNGIAARMFWCTARACIDLGIHEIRGQGLASADTHSTPEEIWSGAVTLVALGFDAVLPADLLPGMPPSIRHCRYLREALATQAGAAWWSAKPRAMAFFFDASPDSKSLQILGTYIRSRKIRLSQ